MPAASINLRPITADDVEIMARWGLDDEICAAAEWSAGKPLAYHREYWQGMIDSPSSDLVRLGVDLGGQRIVGYCDLQGQDLNQRELGFVIAERDLWGVGIGGAAASLMLDYGFNSLHLTTIDAEAWDANDRSIRILQRLGMREIGFGEAGTYRGMPSHFRVFEITRSEWVESLANPGRSQ